MRKRRPAKLAETPEPFRYRPTPPPPVPATSLPPEPSKQRTRLPVGGLTNGAAVVWFILLVLPALSLRRLSESVDWRIIAGALAPVTLVTWFLYRGDKSKAQSGAWRTPESTLHLAELAGGWPAAFLAQRRYRHKIAKTRFQVFYWSIVFLHQFAAFDYLLGWRFSRDVVEMCRGAF